MLYNGQVYKIIKQLRVAKNENDFNSVTSNEWLKENNLITIIENAGDKKTSYNCRSCFYFLYNNIKYYSEITKENVDLFINKII